jgi:hypothetical protein
MGSKHASKSKLCAIISTHHRNFKFEVRLLLQQKITEDWGYEDWHRFASLCDCSHTVGSPSCVVVGH